MGELERRPGSRGGFIHVPLLPEQALEQVPASMPLDTLVQAAEVVIACCSG
jgi:pyrrolidone-carboxylate peptidase